jgi:hypothetical protein
MPFLIDMKDLILLVAGVVLGYLANLVVAKQTEKRKNLVLQVVSREIVVERTSDCPFSIASESGEALDNIYFFVTRVWNRGTDAVRGDEVSLAAPLGIEIAASAQLLGEPKIMKPHDDMEFSVAIVETNKYAVTFDCLNPDEWVQVGFFVTGDPRAPIKGSGRVFGQYAEFDVSTDDSRAPWSERLNSLIAFLLVVLSPLSLCVAIWWAYTDYHVLDLVADYEKLPRLLQALFALGVFVPFLAAMYFGSIWLKRRANPKGYPIREDFEPSQWQALRAFLLTAITGKRYQVSMSVYDYGELKPRASGRTT